MVIFRVSLQLVLLLVLGLGLGLLFRQGKG